MVNFTYRSFFFAGGIALLFVSLPTALSFSVNHHHGMARGMRKTACSKLFSTEEKKEAPPVDFEEPEDAVVHIQPKAMMRLRELKAKQPDPNETLVLRMGVRNGGCSGLSYVMDFSTESEIQEDDAVDEYKNDDIKCVVDAKSMLYLYGLELDYSDELIGGGFKFFNPNAEESCGCGSSFGV